MIINGVLSPSVSYAGASPLRPTTASEGHRQKCDPPDVVIITPAILLHDELGVIEHEGTEDKEAKVQVHLQAATDALTHTPMSFQMFLLALLTKGE